jgi:hypothetical protein
MAVISAWNLPEEVTEFLEFLKSSERNEVQTFKFSA